MIQLRDYQQEALKAVIEAYQAKVNRQLIMLPTGSGKTIVMAAIAKHFNKRTLLLAHREELIQQAYEKFRLFWPEASIGVCMAERNELDRQVVIGSIQSCSRLKRLENLKEQKFEVLMIDEAHHATADSYQTIINALHFDSQSDKLLLGVTATPLRADKQGLDCVFEKLTFSRSIGTMIKAGYLSPVLGRKILTNFNLEKIQTRNGDFAIEDLSEAVNTQERNDFVVQKFNEYARDRKGVAFCVDVQHCKDLADAFRSAGINSFAVFGEMPTHERKNAIESLRSGKIQIATSCNILTEGFDEPSIDCIIMARPTKSAGLYIQCVGRGLRLWPGKQNCFVLDFTDRGHNLDSVMKLSTAIPEALYFKSQDHDTESEEAERTSKISVLEECDREFDVLGCSRFIWIPIGDNEWSLIDDEKREIVINPSANGFIAFLLFPDGSSSQIVKTPLPLEYCSGVCEDYARHNLKIAFADAKALWWKQNAQPTQGQKEFLEKHNAFKNGMSKANAAIEIRKIIALKNKQRRLLNESPITMKQKYFLTSHGIDPNKMSKFQAIKEIGRIKQQINDK